jgi:hypothetical protein
MNHVVLPPVVYLLLPRHHPTEQPMGVHADTDQALIFKVVDSVAQGGYDWELGSCGFFGPCTTKLRESANEGWEARFMVFVIKPGLVPSLERSLHLQIQETTVRAHLEAYAANDLSFIDTGLILQQEIAFQEGKIWRHAEKGFA